MLFGEFSQFSLTLLQNYSPYSFHVTLESIPLKYIVSKLGEGRVLNLLNRVVAKRNYWRGGNPNLPIKKTSLKPNLLTKKAFLSFQCRLPLLVRCKFDERLNALGRVQHSPHPLWLRHFFFCDLASYSGSVSRKSHGSTAVSRRKVS